MAEANRISSVSSFHHTSISVYLVAVFAVAALFYNSCQVIALSRIHCFQPDANTTSDVSDICDGEKQLREGIITAVMCRASSPSMSSTGSGSTCMVRRLPE